MRTCQPQFAYRLDGAVAVDAVALRTPPYSMIATELDPAGADELVRAWLHEDPGASGANGQPATVRARSRSVARTDGRRTARRRGRWPCTRSRRSSIHRRPPAGRLRLGVSLRARAAGEVVERLCREADAIGGAHAAATVDVRLSTGDLFVWDDDGPSRCVAISPTVAGVVRIGPVYTPPERRRCGYAGMAVAEVSRRLSPRRQHACMLFTDLANPDLQQDLRRGRAIAASAIGRSTCSSAPMEGRHESRGPGQRSDRWSPPTRRT